MTTPRSPVARAYPSAMYAAPDSWRQMTYSTSSRWRRSSFSRSMTAAPGMPKSLVTPSILR